MKLTETHDGWHLTLHAGRVQMIQIDFRLSLLVADGQDSSWLHIETQCKLTNRTEESVLVPEQATTIAPVLPLFNASVAGMVIEKTGVITIQFENESILHIGPDVAFEAWQLSTYIGDEKVMLICSPGGEVTVFKES